MKNHEFTNRLINETSPYLLQHAHNPVDWHPWGNEALTLAKSLDKPILVSIGYSACHWCHVMERESFEEIAVAEFMNLHFVNIKIDREERPDLDHIYMEALQILTGSGGWPLNVFLTPEGYPFFGGTYFPPINVYNRPSWMDVLRLINDIWKNKRSEAEEQAKKLINHIRSLSASFNNQLLLNQKESSLQKINHDFLKGVKDKLLKNADRIYGGFGAAPKFPQTMSIQFLLAYNYFFKDEVAKEHALFSLKALLKGGIYDHLAGGLARYSTDEKWLAPHFEKMLYDNALLIDALCDAYQISKDIEYKIAIEDIIRFCLNELHEETGGFYAALDADSDGEEGKYYTWDKEEIVKILGNEADIFCEFYGVEEKGNWEGKNILYQKQTVNEFAAKSQIDAIELNQLIENAKSKLHNERKKKNRPSTDDKILLGWNALFLIALCKSSAALENQTYRQLAENLYEFLNEKFSENDTIVFHSYKNGEKKHKAFLEDYAYFIKACICLQELTGNDKYLVHAKELTNYVIENFKQETGGLFYYTSKNQDDVVIRKVEVYDAAIPSANSIMAENLMYLSKIFENQAFQIQAEEMIISMLDYVEKYPASFSVWSAVILKFLVGFKDIVITGKCADELLKKVLLNYIPNKIIQASTVKKNYPLLKSKNFSNVGLIYVCEDFSCLAPIDNIAEFEKLIQN